MGAEAWTTVAVTAAIVAAMALNIAGPDLIMVAGLTVLLLLGIVTPEQALSGFSNEAVLTVAALFVVAAGIRDTGGLDVLARRVLGQPRSLAGAQLRLMLPVAGMSAFLNNTPVVAMLVPIVGDWSRRVGIPVSRLLIPLSYAAMLGGTCTLIGTSTNLVVAGLAAERDPTAAIGMFDIALVGVPTLVLGVLFILLTSRWLLPDRQGVQRSLDNPREYTVAMRVEKDSPVAGQTIEDAGLRHLPGLYLVEIERDGQLLVAVGPEERIYAGDTLVFAGVVESVVDLRKIRGLVPATDQVRKLAQPTPERRMIEAVIAPHSPMVGRSVRETRFRTSYDAAIIAVHRRGERVGGKVGDIILSAGDTLLLEAHPSFLERHRNDSDFALVSEVEGSAPPKHDKAWLATLVLCGMVAANTLGLLPLLTAALLAAGMMIATRCIDGGTARRSLELSVLITIAAAFGISAALETTGAARVIASSLVSFAVPLGPIGVLAAIYVVTAVVTLLISNNAAAALMFPIAMAAQEAAGFDGPAVVFVLMLAASACFATPIGYQTNLMVLGPGGYRFGDFFRIGVPLQLVLGALAVAVASFLWL